MVLYCLTIFIKQNERERDIGASPIPRQKTFIKSFKQVSCYIVVLRIGKTKRKHKKD